MGIVEMTSLLKLQHEQLTEKDEELGNLTEKLIFLKKVIADDNSPKISWSTEEFHQLLGQGQRLAGGSNCGSVGGGPDESGYDQQEFLNLQKKVRELLASQESIETHVAEFEDLYKKSLSQNAAKEIEIRELRTQIDNLNDNYCCNIENREHSLTFLTVENEELRNQLMNCQIEINNLRRGSFGGGENGDKYKGMKSSSRVLTTKRSSVGDEENRTPERTLSGVWS
jgi:hypothetical protein